MAFDAPFAGMAAATSSRILNLVMPVFTWEAMVNIALPLFIVTMAGQNLPGLAVLAVYGYRPRVAPLLLSTGAASVAGAPFGMPTINLAAITAALGAGPTRIPIRRAATSPASSAASATCCSPALAGIAAVLVARSPPVLIEAVAGLALIGAFGSAMLNACRTKTAVCPASSPFW
jgi:benzoate membrane transport protein